MSRARITIGSTGANGEVELDGQRISNMVRGFTLHGSVHEVTRLELDVVLLEGAEVDAEPNVVVPQVTHDLLVMLGWKPPD